MERNNYNVSQRNSNPPFPFSLFFLFYDTRSLTRIFYSYNSVVFYSVSNYVYCILLHRKETYKGLKFVLFLTFAKFVSFHSFSFNGNQACELFHIVVCIANARIHA